MTAPKPDWSRVRKTVRFEPTDRVPLSEAVIAYEIQSRFLGRPVGPDDIGAQVEFWSKAGYDYIPLNIGMMEPGKVTENSHISKILKKRMADGDDPGRPDGDPKRPKWNLEVTSFIHNQADFEAFPWEEVGNLDLSRLVRAAEYLPEGMKVIGVSGKIFTLTWMLMGFNNFAMGLIRNPKLVTAVFEKVAAIQYSALDQVLALPQVGAVWVVDDVAYNSGPIISVKHLEQFVFPWYKEMARRCHEAGRLFFLHTDGKLDALLPSFFNMGLDVVQPIDPTCNDIVEIKKKTAGKLTIVGNVSNELLQEGTPEEVRAYTRMLLREVAPGGGFMLGSGNSVPDWAQYENYQAMRETVLNEGRLA